jgi:CRISPR-associated protein Cmr2
MSNNYLISVAIGPVQDFIASALRTRDLWYGSYLLSLISKAVARKLNEQGCELIFPFVADASELEHSSRLSVVNNVIARVEVDHSQLESLLAVAKKAAYAGLQEIFTCTLNKYNQLCDNKPNLAIRQDVWDAQCNDPNLLELFAVAVPINEDDYSTARKRLNLLASARKNTRDFTADYNIDQGLPKSSLDARRDTVLPKALQNEPLYRRKMGLSEAEQLDALGLVKRLSGGRNADHFTPTTRIASDQWIRHHASTETGQADLDEIADAAKILVQGGWVTNATGNKSHYAQLPYDAGFLYLDHLQATIEKAKAESSADVNALENLKRLVKAKVDPAPTPYYALLMADGDHMGALLSSILDNDQQASFAGQGAVSKTLSEFCATVPHLAKQYNGHSLYAGGDDVMVMLPVANAIKFANELRKQFYKALQKVIKDLGLNIEKAPTLSAGIVFAHMQTPMGRVRQLVKQAEKLAKGDPASVPADQSPRNALGLIIAPRSGTQLSLRMNWPSVSGDSDDALQLEKLVEVYANRQLSWTFPYALRESMQLIENLDAEQATLVAKSEFQRVLSRRNASGSADGIDQETKAFILNYMLPNDNGGLNKGVVQHHLVARWLAKQISKQGGH